MLTKTNADGTWSVQDVDFEDCEGNMYGALCKLRDYEKTGLEPSDFKSDSYQKANLYKVFCSGLGVTQIFYCNSEITAEGLAKMLRDNGFENVMVDRHCRQVFIENGREW